MPTEPIDVPGITSPEAPQEPTVAQEPAPLPPETIPFKVRGEERQVSAASLDALASELGTSRDAALMWLQSGKDYGQHIQELRQRERELTQIEAELSARYQEMEKQRSARMQGAPTQPMQQNGLPGGDDPMEYLRFLAQRVGKLDEIEQKIVEREQFWQQNFEKRQQAEEAEKIESAYTRLKDWVSREYPKISVPAWQELESELVQSGLAQNRRVSWDEAMQRAFKNLAWDRMQQVSQQSALERVRHPQAQIVVPGNQASSQPAPKTGSSLDQLGDMKFGEITDFIPRAR